MVVINGGNWLLQAEPTTASVDPPLTPPDQLLAVIVNGTDNPDALVGTLEPYNMLAGELQVGDGT